MDSLSVSVKERKIIWLADDEKLDEAVYLWFIQKRSLGIPVSGVVLSKKAMQFHEQLHPEESESHSKRARVGCGSSAIDTEYDNCHWREKSCPQIALLLNHSKRSCFSTLNRQG